MGGVEGPQTSGGFLSGADVRTKQVRQGRHLWLRHERPQDIGGPSTPPMLPRSAQDDKRLGTALALEAMRFMTS